MNRSAQHLGKRIDIGVTNLTLVLLYEKHFGWQAETFKKKLGAYELSRLTEDLNADEKVRVSAIYSPAARLDLALSYQASIDLLIALSKQKAGHFGAVLDVEFMAYIKQFMDEEINRFQDQ